MNELKPEDVVRALEHCANYKRQEVSCIGCPLYKKCDVNTLEGLALALLREKNALIADYIRQIAEMQAQIATQESELTELMKCKHIEADKDAEIEKLKIEIEALKIANEKMYQACQGIRAESITELEQRLMQVMCPDYPISTEQVHRICEELKRSSL